MLVLWDIFCLSLEALQATERSWSSDQWTMDSQNLLCNLMEVTYPLWACRGKKKKKGEHGAGWMTLDTLQITPSVPTFSDFALICQLYLTPHEISDLGPWTLIYLRAVCGLCNALCFLHRPQITNFLWIQESPFRDSRNNPQEHNSRNQKQSNANSKAGKLTKTLRNEQGSESFP